MRRIALPALVIAAALVAVPGALATARTARAQEKPPADAGKGDEKHADKGGDKSGDKSGKSDAAQPSRQERARRIVQELETTIALLKAAKTADAETIKSLEKALEEARALAKPITLAELTEDEKKALAEELKKAADGGKDPAGPEAGGKLPGDEWRKAAIDGAFRDADLSEDEQIEAKKIIQDWFDKSRAAQLTGDSKRVSDLKRQRDDQLEKALGRKKAQKVVNNLNAMGPRR
jgi:hypothetical protein